MRVIVDDRTVPALVVTVYRTSRYQQVFEGAMKVTYDAEVDVLRIISSAAVVDESDENKPGVIIDYDKNGNIVGMEILDASKRMENPFSVDYAVTGA